MRTDIREIPVCVITRYRTLDSGAEVKEFVAVKDTFESAFETICEIEDSHVSGHQMRAENDPYDPENMDIYVQLGDFVSENPEYNIRLYYPAIVIETPSFLERLVGWARNALI